jgi:hypothetical protein
MPNDTLLDLVESEIYRLKGQVLEKTYFFHDVRILCQANHPTILAILDEMLEIFPEPKQIQGEVTYSIVCYEHSEQFPIQLPFPRKRTETVRLVTNTKLKYYQDHMFTTEFQSYDALPPVNGVVLTALSQKHNLALTQLEMPNKYQASFLRRYVFLLALGQIMCRFGFDPCHAATITAPWDDHQGALILGASGSGKTTLSLQCASLGCGFLGDDLVMLGNAGDSGLINAYAITHEFALRTSSLRLWDSFNFLYSCPADMRDKRYCSIDKLYNGIGRLQTPVRLLLFPTITTKSQSVITPLSKSHALQQLIATCVSTSRRSAQTQAQLFAFLSQLADQSLSYQLEIAQNAGDGPQLVLSLFTGGCDDY